MATTARKTVSVNFLRDKVNYLLANELLAVREDESPEDAYRRGAASVLEAVLHETGNYHGFGYHDLSRNESGEYDIPNESRRMYY